MKKCVSFVLSALLILSVFAVPFWANAKTEENIDVSFREMEKSGDLNSTNLDFSISTQKYTQGSACVAYTVGEEGPSALMVVNLYRLGNKDNPVDITGATHLTMDIWVPTDGLLDSVSGDAGINVDDAENLNKWGGSAAKVSASTVKSNLKGLKAGWNFVVFPLVTESSSTTAADMRFYLIKSGLPEGTKIYIDDVRFVNQAALATVAEDRNAAKAVVGMLNDGNAHQGKTAYENLLHRQRVYFPETLCTKFNLEPIAPTVQYTATFDLDGGTGDIASQNVYVGDTLRDVPRPTKEGYAFGGWYVSKTKVDLATYQMPAKDTTFIAKWVSPVTVTFDVNGGKTPIAPQVLPAGSALDPIETPKRGGHRFDGWYIGDTKIDLATYTVPQANVTLTAKWLPYRYFLKFNANSGLDINPYRVVECASAVSRPITPLREGYVFDGWYNGMSKVDFATFTMPDADVTLNAKWNRGEETLLGFGKVTEDSVVDAKDALAMLQYSVKKRDFTIDQTFYANVNTDSKIDAKDALLVLQYSVKKITAFPAEAYYAQYVQPAPPAAGPIYPGDPVPDPDSKPDPEPKPEPTPVDLDVNIMSFNIRQSGANNELDGDNGWLNRKSYVMDYLNNSGMDVLCLQEVRKSQGEDITATLSAKYKGVYFGREPIANPEGLMTIYNAQKFELVSQEMFWLSETPEVASKGWGANYYRICAVLVLKEKATGKLLNVFNVHLDHQVELSRVNGLKLVMERLKAKEGHAIVAGDFNTTSASGCYNIIGDVMTDCSSAPGAKVFSTCQGFGAGKGNQNGSPIDFIFVNPTETAISNYKICNDTFTDSKGTTRNYSDHYAVTSTVTFTYQ